MKNALTSSLLTLALISGIAHAESTIPVRGTLTFVGKIVNGLCNTPTSTWQQHLGRDNGISPRKAPRPEAAGNCAGVGQTSSVSLAPIAAISSRGAGTGVITVTFH